MNSDELLKLKKLLDEGAISQEEFEREKSKLFTQQGGKRSNKALIMGVVCVAFLCICILSSNFGNDNSGESIETSTTNKIENDIPIEFRDEIPISVSGKMYDNIIGMPELSVSIKNNTDKNISAIKLYFCPADVYGDEITGIFTTNYLYTDDKILAGTTVSKAWQMLDNTVKSGVVYVYSIYFEDGTEWGNKDAAVSEIQKYAYKFNVEY